MGGSTSGEKEKKKERCMGSTSGEKEKKNERCMGGTSGEKEKKKKREKAEKKRQLERRKKREKGEETAGKRKERREERREKREKKKKERCMGGSTIYEIKGKKGTREREDFLGFQRADGERKKKKTAPVAGFGKFFTGSLGVLALGLYSL